MKTKSLIFMAALVYTLQGAQAQIPVYKQPYKSVKDFKGDVLMYLKYNFLDTKENLMGKNLISLLDKIEPNLLEYVLMFAHTPAGVKGIRLYFENDSMSSNKAIIGQYLVLRVTFQNLLVPLDSVFILAKKNKKQWTNDERRFYGQVTIKDLTIDGLPSNGGPPPMEYKGEFY